MALGRHTIEASNARPLVSEQMNRLVIARAFAFGAFLFLLAGHLTEAQQTAEWTWKEWPDKPHTRAELDEILQKHREWIESDRKSGSRANLFLAQLLGVDLSLANLNSAQLSGANLSGAYLNDADLRGANLTDANLSGADLRGAYLADADLYLADLGRAIFEPKSLPDLRGIAAGKSLQFLTYKKNPDALTQLRKQFQDGGFREQEREITYALKRREAELSWEACRSRRLPLEDKTRAILWSSDSNLANCGSFILNKVFFDWTCQYGMSPGRPLSLGVALWLLCSLLYFACICASGEAGLYRVYGPDIQEDPSADRRVERISPRAVAQTWGLRRFFQYFRSEWLVFRTSMFFSVMSAFNIGFRDINFGRWLRLLTRQEFDIKAVGWARVVAGWQSLISVFLIALWVLTYFGRPFG